MQHNQMPNMLNRYYETPLSQFFMVPFRRILGTHNRRFMPLALILIDINKYVCPWLIWGHESFISVSTIFLTVALTKNRLHIPL